MSNIYKNFLEQLEKALNEDNFENINYILEFLYTSPIPEKDFLEIEEILQEVTLYSEFKEAEYKEKALELICDFK